MREYLLEMRNISKRFFGVEVLRNAQLCVRPGEVHILLGENGAGKSTLIKILSGAYERESGEIILDGISLPPLEPRQALELGIRVIYQEFNLYPDLSICENIFTGRELKRGIFIDRQEELRQTQAILEKVGLEAPPQTLIRDLTVAQKQLVEIAKAISARVRILVLDEPTAALTDKETNMLFRVIRELKKEGLGIIYISHRMSEFFQIGDRCTVMRNGAYIDTVSIAETSTEQLTKMMVGHAVSPHRAEGHCQPEQVLSVRTLRYKSLVRNVSFDLHRGEILGLTGLIGSGCAETVKCIMGILRPTGGEILYRGELLSSRLSGTIQNGIVYLSDDRKDEGLIQIHSVMDNITLPSLDRFASPFLTRRRLAQTTDEYIAQLRIKTHARTTEVQYLSGGNQQKIVISKWLCAGADVYIFNEPTRGIDVGSRAEIYKIMDGIVSRGASILMITSDLQELMQLSDRIIVMKDGAIRTILENDPSLTQKEILEYAMQEGEVHAVS